MSTETTTVQWAVDWYRDTYPSVDGPMSFEAAKRIVKDNPDGARLVMRRVTTPSEPWVVHLGY